MNKDPNSFIDSSSIETPTPKLMNNQEAINIIQMLIDGINPLSDEPLCHHSLCLNSDIKRAFQAAIPALESKIKANVRQSNLPNNAGKPWDSDEDEQLITAFDQGDSVATIAEHHQRTKGSITSRLGKLGKVIV